MLLHTIFRYRERDYKGNRIPESYDHLLQAAQKIKELYFAQKRQVDKSSDDPKEKESVEDGTEFVMSFKIHDQDN